MLGPDGRNRTTTNRYNPVLMDPPKLWDVHTSVSHTPKSYSRWQDTSVRPIPYLNAVYDTQC